jgi:hypothetical protein
MKQPWVVTAIGILFLAAGAAGFVHHMQERPIDRWMIVVELIGVLAVVGGVFLLMGRGWARWLLLVWLAFHVGISALDSLGKLAFHAVLLLVIGYALLRPPASEYFRAKRQVEP